MEKSALRGVKIFLTILGLVTVLLTFIFAFLNSAPTSLLSSGNTTQNSAPGLFIQTITSNFPSKYPSATSPASWVFAIIWPIIFIWNIVGSSYMTASLCIPFDRSPIMREPAMVPIPSLVLWFLSFATSMSWIFAYDREYFGLSLFFLIVSAWSAYGFLGFSYRSYYSDILLLEENSNKMLWLVRILIHNGFAIYATWLTCAWKLNLKTVITFVDSRGIDKIPADYISENFTEEDGGTVILSLILFELVVWFILENFVFEAYCRYTITIYPTLIFAFTGIFARNYVYPYSTNQILTVLGLLLACLAFFIRLPLVVYRHMHRMRHA